MFWWQVIVFPFALLFDGVTRIRNLLYDRRIERSNSFDANVIVVGNLSIGGTGKTPMVDYLIRYFHSLDVPVSTLSRGYGRSTRGFRLAGPTDTAQTIGDEPFLYYRKYKGLVPVAVGEERDLAIAELLLRAPDTKVTLLDDAFQHRRVVPSMALLMTTFDHPFYEDYLLPAGRLREARMGAKRADVIIVSKCPDYLTPADQVKMREKIKVYSSATVFFTKVVYQEPLPFRDDSSPLRRNVIGISGMADPTPFEQYLKRNYGVKLTHNYRDHHRYRAEDIRDILRELDGNTSLITTEKDMVKLREFEELRDQSCYFIPIEAHFLKDEAQFHAMLESELKKYGQPTN